MLHSALTLFALLAQDAQRPISVPRPAPRDWSALSLELTTTRAEVVQGMPIEVAVAATNCGDVELDVSHFPGANALCAVALLSKVGEHGPVEMQGVRRSECWVGPYGLPLPPGGWLQEVVTIQTRIRGMEERREGLSVHIPRTDSPGAYSVWVESELEGWGPLRAETKIDVLGCDGIERKAYDAFIALSCVEQLYRRPSADPRHTQEITDFVARWPHTPYADLGHFWLAQQALIWARPASEPVERLFACHSGRSAKENFTYVEELVGRIDAERFPMPIALREFLREVEVVGAELAAK